jgi:hypothetical protein
MREVLFNICMVSIALCLFKMLLPETALKKQANFLIACFFLSALLHFFTSGNVDLSQGLSPDTFAIEEIPHRDFEHEFRAAQERAVAREVSRAAEFTIAQVLAEQNIFPEQIIANINISDEHSISISEVRLVFQSIDEIESLVKAVHITQKEVGERVLVTGIISEH